MVSTGEASILMLSNEEVEEVEAPQKIDYSSMTVVELRALCKERGITGYSSMNKSQLIEVLSS